MGVCGFVAVPVDLFEGERDGRMGGGEEEKQPREADVNSPVRFVLYGDGHAG